MIDGVFRVEVVSGFIDTPSLQWTSVQMVKAFANIRHLDVRLSGWGIGQRCVLRVGANTVPAVLETLVSSTSFEELTIDLETLSHNDVLATFGSLMSSKAYPGLQKVTITSSGDENITKHTLRELGKAFKSLDSIQELQLSGMDPEHLSVILETMQMQHESYQSARTTVVPALLLRSPNAWECECDSDPYMSSNVEGGNGYPKHLIIEKSRLFHRAMIHLSHLVLDEKPRDAISNLTLRDCVHYTEDLGCLTFLIKGQSSLRELSLERLRICSFPGASSPLWNPCATKGLNTGNVLSNNSRLTVVRLMDCKGSLDDVETITNAIMYNSSLERLILQYSTSSTASMVLHPLNALHEAIVVNNSVSSLLELKIKACPQIEAYGLHQLSALLGHTNCVLQKLTLHLGSGPYQLDVLTDNLRESMHLKHLCLSGDDKMDVKMLDLIVDRLQHAPRIISLEMDFPGIHEANEEVQRVFETNTTLKRIRVQPPPGAYHRPPIHIFFYELRNCVHHLLISREGRTTGTWHDLLTLIFSWFASPGGDRTRLGVHGADLVYLSSLWYAMMEYPLLLSELEFLGHS